MTVVHQLYNTMQVREATKSTKMNQIMLLFTVATILYLPPSFIAVSSTCQRITSGGKPPGLTIVQGIHGSRPFPNF